MLKVTIKLISLVFPGLLKRFSLVVMSMRVTLRDCSPMEKENIHGQMGLLMREIGKKEK